MLYTTDFPVNVGTNGFGDVDVRLVVSDQPHPDGRLFGIGRDAEGMPTLTLHGYSALLAESHPTGVLMTIVSEMVAVEELLLDNEIGRVALPPLALDHPEIAGDLEAYAKRFDTLTVPLVESDVQWNFEFDRYPKAWNDDWDDCFDSDDEDELPFADDPTLRGCFLEACGYEGAAARGFARDW